MKKNSFMQGAFIATLGIVLSKILGIIYVIPFYAIIGAQGGALYGYGYSIYSIFLGISQAGIPLAISKIVSEYNVLGYYEAKRRTFKLGKKVLAMLGVASFIIMFIFAKPLALVIIGIIFCISSTFLSHHFNSSKILIISSLNLIFLITQGLPQHIEYDGKSLVTTELAPIITPLPIWTPGSIVTFWPIQQSLPTTVSPLNGKSSIVGVSCFQPSIT